jgi:hypothetical protein
VDLKVAVLATQVSSGVSEQSAAPRRVLDTRAGKIVAANTTRGITLAQLGVPAGTAAVSVQVTLVGVKAGGAVGIGACKGTPWIVTFGRQSTTTFRGVVTVNSGGLCITPTVAAHVTVDVTEVWAP